MPTQQDPVDETLSSIMTVPTPPTLLPAIHRTAEVGADPNNENDLIPACFVQGCQNNMEEARRRWQVTKHWRSINKVDTILGEPQPNFCMIKALYPHAVHKISKSGHLVYIERPGHAKLSTIFKSGLTMLDLERHYTFITEYLFRVIEPRPEGQIISIFDIDGCALSDLAGDTLKMFQRCSGLVGAHYPERSHKIFLINAPWWIQAAWNIMSPFLDPNTGQKVVISKSAYGKQLAQYVRQEDLPTLIGGTDSVAFGESQFELEMLELVKRLNEKVGYPTKADFCVPGKSPEA